MTTDPFPKEHAVTVQTGRGLVHVGGIGQGLGHDRAEHGDDARLPDDGRRRSRRRCCSGRSSSRRATPSTPSPSTASARPTTACSRWRPARAASTIDDELYPALLEALLAVSRELALGIVRGGEGATKLIAVNVHDARSRDDARQVARTIANSPLVKTAVHGADPELGTHRRRRRPVGRRCSTSIAPRCTSAACCCSRTGCRTTRPRRRRPSI